MEDLYENLKNKYPLGPVAKRFLDVLGSGPKFREELINDHNFVGGSIGGMYHGLKMRGYPIRRWRYGGGGRRRRIKYFAIYYMEKDKEDTYKKLIKKYPFIGGGTSLNRDAQIGILNRRD